MGVREEAMLEHAVGGCGRSLGMKEIGKRMEERRPCEGLVGDLGESSW